MRLAQLAGEGVSLELFPTAAAILDLWEGLDGESQIRLFSSLVRSMGHTVCQKLDEPEDAFDIADELKAEATTMTHRGQALETRRVVFEPRPEDDD
jgi:hypothetical protein